MTQLFALILITLSLSPLAHAGSTGQINLSGTVDAVNDIVVSASGNLNLNILGGETGKNVASVAETSNSGTGYNVTISSQNGGMLKNLANASYGTAYQLSYNGGSYAQPGTGSAVVKNVPSLSAKTTATSQVMVKVTALPNAPAGDYADVLTITIAANP